MFPNFLFLFSFFASDFSRLLPVFGAHIELDIGRPLRKQEVRGRGVACPAGRGGRGELDSVRDKGGKQVEGRPLDNFPGRGRVSDHLHLDRIGHDV